MGVVFKSEDTRLGCLSPSNFFPRLSLPTSICLPASAAKRRAASSLNHPNICTIYDICEDDGRAFIAMEYLEAETFTAKGQFCGRLRHC